MALVCDKLVHDSAIVICTGYRIGMLACEQQVKGTAKDRSWYEACTLACPGILVHTAELAEACRGGRGIRRTRCKGIWGWSANAALLCSNGTHGVPENSSAEWGLDAGVERRQRRLRREIHIGKPTLLLQDTGHTPEGACLGYRTEGSKRNDRCGERAQQRARSSARMEKESVEPCMESHSIAYKTILLVGWGLIVCGALDGSAHEEQARTTIILGLKLHLLILPNATELGMTDVVDAKVDPLLHVAVADGLVFNHPDSRQGDIVGDSAGCLAFPNFSQQAIKNGRVGGIICSC
ncbi:hypothetical protein DFH09DRAFT_1428150 [Mycena vulgaris]|nr:hypothetical protein DFH09DRAFT_1428150 [Mycena vulgaris]